MLSKETEEPAAFPFPRPFMEADDSPLSLDEQIVGDVVESIGAHRGVENADSMLKVAVIFLSMFEMSLMEVRLLLLPLPFIIDYG